MAQLGDWRDLGARVDANTQVITNVDALRRQRGWTQGQLAERLGKDQPWVSRRLHQGPHQIQWSLDDLDLLAAVFGFTPQQLLQPGHGDLDRRSGQDRRAGVERRQLGQRFGPLPPRSTPDESLRLR
jgi:transcriptional regulator with XRE-family HTH domain